MAAGWSVADALMGGTAAMRAAGKTLLPKWPNEDKASYDLRLATATLFPAFSRTVGVMTGKPFAKQITLGDDVPSRIEVWCDDVDQQGNNLHSFLSGVLEECLAFGLCGVLVDHPPVDKRRVKTLADETRLGLRPYAVFIRHSQILGWKTQTVGGMTTLTQLRLKECELVDDGLFGVSEEPRVRVLVPGGWAVYMPGPKPEDDWVIEDEGKTSIKVIPFTPFYGRRHGFMCGHSPLLELAYQNVKHWQSQSDQDTILHVARVPVLAVIGAQDQSADGTGGTQLTIGASAAVQLPLGAEMKYVEHTGKAIEAGAKSLLALEEQMVQTGAELLVKKEGQRTAKESSIDAEGNKSELQRIVESFEDSVDQVLQLMAEWVKEPDGGHATIFKDFAVDTLSDASAQLLMDLRELGIIGSELLLAELKRRNIIAADATKAIEAGKTEGPIATAVKAVTEPN